MAKLAVQILGDSAGLRAALGESTAATEKWAAATRGSSVKVAESFKGVSTAALQAQVAQDKLAISYGRYGEGTLGAAAATIRYRKEIEALSAASTASLSTVGRNLTKYVSLPLAAVGYEAARMAVTFQQEMLKIQTQAGASAAEVKNLSGQVLELAKSTPQGPEQLAQGLYHLESIGLRGAKAMDTLRIAALAAGMGTANLEDATSALGGAVVTGIKGTENYTQAMGLLNATIGAGNLTMQDLLDALGTGLLPKAKNAGVSLDEVGAALATLTDRGIPAQKAATQLGTTFALMMAPSKAAQKALKQMGIGATELRTELASPGGLLKVLETLRAGMDKVGKGAGATDILSAFGRSRQSGAILTLVESLNSGLSSYDAKITQVNANAKTYAANQQAYLASPAYKLHTALSTVESDLTKLGESILPEITKAAGTTAQAINGIADIFNKLPGPVKGDIGVLAGVLAAGGPLLLAVAAARRAIRFIGTEFNLLPAEAAPGIAATGAELETGIGAAAVGAETKIAALRGSLLGLGALSIAPIVIPIEIRMAKSEHDWITKHLGSLGGAGKALLDIATGDVAGNPVNDIGSAVKGSLSTSNPTIGSSEPTGTSAAAEAAAKAAAGRARSAPSPTPTASTAGASAGKPSTAAVTAYHPSRAAELNLALAKNPDDKGAIEAKLAYDRQAAGFAEQRIASGRGSKSLEQQLQSVYSDESSLQGTLKSMAAAAAAAKKKAAKATAQFTLPLGLQIGQAAAALTPQTGDDKKAAAAVRAYIDRLLPHLTGQKKLTALQDLAGVMPAATGFSVPLKMQLAVAKAGATAQTGDDRKAAAEIKAYDEKLLASHKESIQSQIDIYNSIAAQNSVLGGKASNAVKESSEKFTAGIAGLSVAARRTLEQRFAQVQAHGGYTPTGHGVLGQSITIHVHGDPNPDVTADRVIAKLQRHGRHGTAQRRGPHAGAYLGLH